MFYMLIHEINVIKKCHVFRVFIFWTNLFFEPNDNSAVFLKYVTQLGLALSSEIKVQEIREFDGSMLISYDGKNENVSNMFAESIYVELL